LLVGDVGGDIFALIYNAVKPAYSMRGVRVAFFGEFMLGFCEPSADVCGSVQGLLFKQEREVI
jgi:hypothetical protein